MVIIIKNQKKYWFDEVKGTQKKNIGI